MEKTVDILKTMLAAPAGTFCSAYRTAMKDALARENRYRWHDLTKDPEDLPEAYRAILVLHEYLHFSAGEMAAEYETGFFGDGVFCGAAGSGQRNRVIAWRYIEPYEEEV